MIEGLCPKAIKCQLREQKDKYKRRENVQLDLPKGWYNRTNLNRKIKMNENIYILIWISVKFVITFQFLNGQFWMTF